MALNFSEKCYLAKKAAMLDMDTEEGRWMFYGMARESGLGQRWLTYYLNAYEAAGESGIRALTYRKKISQKILLKAYKKINKYFYDRTPPQVHKEIGSFIEAYNNRITVSETRPLRINSRISGRSYLKSFQVRYTDFDNRWHLYWMRKFDKWWPYVAQKPIYAIKDCLREVEADVHGCFWG